jgi:bifunctional non-homologous end joining protein LigD
MKFKPMLAVLGDEKNIGKDGFVFEPKFDGYRALCFKSSGLKFVSRNGHDLTSDYPELGFFSKIVAKDAIIDGEIVAFDKNGNPSFQLLQNRKKDDSIKVSFIAFDILQKNGKSLLNFPLSKRKEILNETIIEKGNLFLTTYTTDCRKLLSFMRKRGMEGIIAKKINSRYSQSRSPDWIKIKFKNSLDCIILGYTTQKRKISSLILGIYFKNKLIHLGKVGTGFNRMILEDLEKKFKRLERKNPVLEIKEAGATWLMPKLVCEIEFAQVTADKKLRAPVFKGLRDDKNPRDCVLEQQLKLPR